MKSTRLFSLLLAFTFAISVFVPGTIVVAATNTDQKEAKPAPKTYSTFTPNLTQGEEGCKQSLQTGSMAELRSYGQERIDKRIGTVEWLDKKIDASYKKREDTFKSRVSSIEITMNRYTPGNEKNIDTKLPADGKKALKNKVSEKRKVLNTNSTKIKSQEVGDIVSATCNSIFTTSIYGKLVPEVKNQMTLDNLSMNNALNSARYEATNYIYTKNKSNKKVESQLKTATASISSMVKPATNSTSLEQIQSKLNSGQDVTNDINSLNASIKKQTSDIRSTFNQVTTAVKPAYKKSSSSSSSGGSGSTGSSNNTSNGGSTGSSGSTGSGGSTGSSGGSGGKTDNEAPKDKNNYSDKVCKKNERGGIMCVKYTCKKDAQGKKAGLKTDCDTKRKIASAKLDTIIDNFNKRNTSNKTETGKRKIFNNKACQNDKSGKAHCVNYSCTPGQKLSEKSTKCNLEHGKALSKAVDKANDANKKIDKQNEKKKKD